MRFYPLIIILLVLCWGFDVRAQVPQEFSSVPEQWQLSLDVIKSKAQTLMIENNGLQVEYRQLIDQTQKLQQAILDQQYKNEQTARFIKERRGQTDQQVRIEELTQIIKTKIQQARSYDKQLENLAKKKSGIDRNIQSLKYAISAIEFHQAGKPQAQAMPSAVEPKVDDQLLQWRKQLEDASKQEVLLENELEAFKSSDKAKDLNVDAINKENNDLGARLDLLRLQKLQHAKKSSNLVAAQANARRYQELKSRKEELEANINAYEMRLDELRESSLAALSWPAKKKKLVHEMVEADGRNNQMRDKIKVLREDIDILRDQVARLERRVNFAQGAAQAAK